MPGLNIKNPEAYRLAKELTDATGESLTQAIIESMRERLERLRVDHDADVEARTQRILELGAAIRENAPPGYFEQDFDELLYDERGLPR
jgi:antitoxin VapB